MKSKARIGAHPLHPMLILIPAGAFILALVFDIVYLLSDNALWWQATIPTIVVGVIGGLIAAIPGLIDLVGVATRQGAVKIGLTHGILNVIMVALFAWNGWLRWRAGLPPESDRLYGGFWLSLIGVIILVISGWLGGTMVYEYHVGVLEHPEAKDPAPGAARPGMAAD
ncbi:MAG TPA: DUF2231 domain-containing protein [Longimicrobiales bacterium]